MSNRAGGAGEQPDYQSYLLRLWRENEGQEGWRASLESAHAGRRRGFANLEALFSFLRLQTALQPTAHRGEGEGGNEVGKERRWPSGSVFRRSKRRLQHWFKICGYGKERKR